MKVSPARLAMMMFGGSPIRVAVPPMLEASASAIRNGTGGTPSRSQTSSVTGAISSTVVTLSSSAEATAVITTSIDHHPERAAAGPLGRPDRDVLEHAGLLEHADDHHHPEQQEDDVPVDAGALGEERVVGVDDAEEHHAGGPASAAATRLIRSVAIRT